MNILYPDKILALPIKRSDRRNIYVYIVKFKETITNIIHSKDVSRMTHRLVPVHIIKRYKSMSDFKKSEDSTIMRTNCWCDNGRLKKLINAFEQNYLVGP